MYIVRRTILTRQLKSIRRCRESDSNLPSALYMHHRKTILSVCFCASCTVPWRRANIRECMWQINFDGFSVNLEINETALVCHGTTGSEKTRPRGMGFLCMNQVAILIYLVMLKTVTYIFLELKKDKFPNK